MKFISLALFGLGLGAAAQHAAALDAAALEFFEGKVRPVLVEHCYECHGAAKQRGGLRLDGRDAVLKGGESGPALVPGKPEESLLVKAVRREDEDFAMPPKTVLTKDQIAVLEEWVRMGAPDPRTTEDSAQAPTSEQVLERAKTQWAFQPIGKAAVPMGNEEWSGHEVDRFLWAKMAENGLRPTADADPGTMARRLSYVLRGLPPTIDEVQEFARAASEDAGRATEMFTDRWLADGSYGEHFARHWMDVVRYAETHGSENDEILPEAWQFRDYLVRAFNGDVPYDQLVREHIAGDLLEKPRWRDGRNESVIGTAFWRFTEFNHSPVDVKREEGVIIENQIDAIGKAFQGITLSCARCHDHKFDPVLQRDYYALYGVAASSRATMHQLEPPEFFRKNDAALAELKPKIREEMARRWRKQLEQLPGELDKARADLHASGSLSIENDLKKRPGGWLGVFRNPNALLVEHPFYILSRLVRVPPDRPEEFAAAWARERANVLEELAQPEVPRQATLIADFGAGALKDWFRSGSIPHDSSPAGEYTISLDGRSILRSILPAGYYSNVLAQRHAGSLRSRDFILDGERLRVLACGEKDARLRLVIENHQGDSVLFAAAQRDLAIPHPSWFELNIREAWRGRRAYVELVTRDDKPYRGIVGREKPGMTAETDGRSAFGIMRIVLERGRAKARSPYALPDEFWEKPAASWEELVARFVGEVRVALDRWSRGACNDREALLLATLLEFGLLENHLADGDPLEPIVARYRELEAQIPIATRVPGVRDDPTGTDAPLMVRGDWKSTQDPVPRVYLAALGAKPLCTADRQRASGRQLLADAIADPRNPFTARVMVNRVWHWIFGRGLVATVDNFGKLSDPPSHRELLDHLAQEFIAHGWSVKWLVRHLATTRAFRLSSMPADEKAREQDPENKWLARAPVRRLDAESIRDAMLAVSAELRAGSPGPSVPVWLPDSLHDVFRPKAGPLDGAGRRSVYLESRRNFPVDLLRVFDQPKPDAPAGRRSITTTPAQSLAVLNHPFVLEQAARWGARLHDAGGSAEERIDGMWMRALARRPTDGERERALAFLNAQGQSKGAWSDLAHVVFNMKEFIFLR